MEDCHACNDCNGSTACPYQDLSLTVTLWGYIFYTSWKEATPPWWHSHGRYGQVRLVEIPSNGRGPPEMSDWLGFSKHLEHNHRKQRVVNMFACELCMCNRYTSEPHTTFRKELHRTTASQNCHSYQFADKQAERVRNYFCELLGHYPGVYKWYITMVNSISFANPK